jgi:ketosteroid isomerase-like protein
MPPNAKAVSGRANIEQFYAGFLGSGTFAMTLTTATVVANGQHAVGSGSYAVSFTPPAGAPPEVKAFADTGKYVNHWVNQGGTWLIAHNMWNSDIPLPQP